MKRMNKVLIAGASGLVGFAAVRHFARLENWGVVAISRRIPVMPQFRIKRCHA
jgi:NAD(P)-dependent dehydrogenase (short-subunit alcohol dehydrogenase family)